MNILVLIYQVSALSTEILNKFTGVQSLYSMNMLQFLQWPLLMGVSEIYRFWHK